MVSFVDYENRCHPLLVALNQVASQKQKKFTLVLAGRRQSQLPANVLQKFQGGKDAVEDVGISNAAVLEQLQHATEEQCLACAHFSGEDYKAFMLLHPIVESGQRLVVLPRGKQERWIGGYLERITL